MTHPRRLPAPSPRPPPRPEAAPPARAAKDPAAAPAAWIPTARTLVGVTAPGADRTGDQRTRECVRRHQVAWKVAWRASQGSSTSCLVGLSVAAGRGRVGAFDGRDGVATWSRRCLGDVPDRRSSIVSLSAGDSGGLQAAGTHAPSCCGAVALSPSSTRRQLATRFRRSLHPAQGSCWRSQPRCCVVGSFDRVTGVADRRELPELEDRGVGRSRGNARGLTDPQVSWAAGAVDAGSRTRARRCTVLE